MQDRPSRAFCEQSTIRRPEAAPSSSEHGQTERHGRYVSRDLAVHCAVQALQSGTQGPVHRGHSAAVVRSRSISSLQGVWHFIRADCLPVALRDRASLYGQLFPVSTELPPSASIPNRSLFFLVFLIYHLFEPLDRPFKTLCNRHNRLVPCSSLQLLTAVVSG